MQYYQCIECGTYYAAQKVSRKGISIEKVPDTMVCQQTNLCKSIGLCADVTLSGDALLKLLYRKDVPTIRIYECEACKTYYADQNIHQSGIVIDRVPDNRLCQRTSNCRILGLCTESKLSVDSAFHNIQQKRQVPKEIHQNMSVYQCVECGTYYSEQKVTKNGITLDQVPDTLVCQRNEICQTIGLCTDVDLSIDEIINKLSLLNK